ncbi:ArnT family glycosyltransferase [Flavobacterium sp.]|uniref:ArnT family glycosyltransferase n=1 Tax=Flavobacterium sp. TaxID=239 RepID=UPI003D6A2190
MQHIKIHHFFYLFPIFVWVTLYYGLSFDGLYGQDSYEYLRYTEALRSFMQTGKSPGDYFWGVYYPIFGSILSFIIPNTAIALQLISVFAFSITAFYLEKIIQLTYNENSAQNIPFLFFILSPIALVHSILIMSDMLACCFTTLAIYHLLLFIQKDTNRNFLFGAVLAVFALLTRYAAAVILLPFCVLALIHLIKKKNYTYLLLSVLFSGLVAIPHIVIRSQNSLQFLSHPWLQSWSFLNIFQSDFTTVDGETKNRYINLIYTFFTFFHPAFLFFGIVLFAVFLKRRKITFYKYQKLFLTAILLYLLFLGGIPFQNKRFLILSFPLAIAFLFPFIKEFFEVLKNQKAVFIVIILIQFSIGLYYGKPFYQRNSLEKNIADGIRTYQGNTLYAFDIDIALKNRKLDFRYKSLWKEKLPDFEKNALLLVNEKQLEKQWKGKNPWLNWETVKQDYQLEKLKNFPGDFNLYRIVEKK